MNHHLSALPRLLLIAATATLVASLAGSAGATNAFAITGLGSLGYSTYTASNDTPALSRPRAARMSAGLLLGPGAVQATTTRTAVAWGCGRGQDFGQCSVPSGLANVTAISAGDFHNLALEGDGTVVAWGCEGEGQTDWGQCSVPSNLSGVIAIAAGQRHSLALEGDGTVVAWGCGGGLDFGQCSVPNGLSGVTAIAAGPIQSLALKEDGTVVAWGFCDAYGGQCSVPSDLSGVTAIAAGLYHSLALKGDGTVVAWAAPFSTSASAACRATSPASRRSPPARFRAWR